MARYPASVRLWQYYYLCERDGESCKVCKKGPDEVKLEIDHVDGDPNNNAPENIRLTCHDCNIREMWTKIKHKIKTQPSEKSAASEVLSASGAPQGIEREITSKDLVNTNITDQDLQKIEHGTSESGSEIKALEGRRVERQLDVYRESPELRIARDKQPLFRKVCLELILSPGGLTTHRAYYEVSERIDISPTTAMRYLGKATSAAGPFKLGEGPRGHQLVLLREDYWEKKA